MSALILINTWVLQANHEDMWWHYFWRGFGEWLLLSFFYAVVTFVVVAYEVWQRRKSLPEDIS
jgi:hypothetical protein